MYGSVLLVRSYVNIREILRTVRHSEGRGRDQTMLPRFAKPVTAAVVVAVLVCSSVQVRAAVAGGRAAAMPSVGGAKASFAEPPTASYLTTANGVGASQTTPGGLAVPVVHNAPAYPHDGGAALHAQGYAYGPIRSAPAGAAAAFPANYIAPGAPVPMSAPSLGSSACTSFWGSVNLYQGRKFR